MDNEVWSKLVNAARDAEIELRKVSFDTMRPPIPVATYNRLVANAYGRIIALEEKIAAFEGKGDAKMITASPASIGLKGPITGAFQPAAEGKLASSK